MGRLTYRGNNGKGYVKDQGYYNGVYARLEIVAERLTAYEETGLEPEEILKMGMAYEDSKRYSGRLEGKLNAYRALGAVEELAALVKARDEGRVVVLPCKVGDTMYSLVWNIKTEQYDVSSGEIKNVRYDSKDGIIMVSDGEYIRVLGNTVFLTRAGAEAALGGGVDG